MAALAIVRAEHHQCGHPLSESTKQENEFAYQVGDPIRCHACRAISAAQQAQEREHPDSLIWVAELQPRR